MVIRHTALAAALVIVGACAHAEEGGFNVKFSGFGTAALVYSDEPLADYVGSRFQPNGAGFTKRSSFAPDTKLGGQLSAHISDRWSGVVQVVAQHQYDNSYNPALEWANIKFQATPEWSFRAGRIASPNYLLSESRFVGYANPWAHVPTEVYSVLAITSNDGLDLTYRKSFGQANNTFQAYYGTSTAKLSQGKAESKPGWGFNDSLEIGSLTLRAGYTNIELDLTIPSLDPFYAGLNGFIAGASGVPQADFAAAAAQAVALSNKYKLKDMNLSALSIGANYDPGNWFVMGEIVAFKGDGFLTDSTSWYATAGYRIGTFTPYVTYASTKAHIDNETGITPGGAAAGALGAGAAGLNAGINTTLNQFNGSQRSASVGVRWDAVRNVALKAQVEQVRLGSGSAGRFTSVQPGFPYGGKVNLVTLSVDFVF